MNKFRLTALSAALAAASLPVSFTAVAEEGFALEEIVVTAQRRSESLQDVPIAITAFGEDAITNSDLDGVESIQSQVPGLVWASFGNQPQITLRGIGVETPSISAEPGVALNVDGIYQPRLSGQQSIFGDLERIEVLRGPQGTLYGRNTVGGAVNIFTKTPTGETEGNISLLAGDEGHTRVRGGYSFPIIEDVLAARISFAREDKDGFREDINTGDTDGSEHKSARLVVNWTPSEDLTVTTRILRSEDEANGPVFQAGQDVFPFTSAATGIPVNGGPFSLTGLPAAFGADPAEGLGLFNIFNPGTVPAAAGVPFLAQQAINDPRDFANDALPDVNVDSLSASNVIEWDIGDVILKSTSSYSDYEYIRDNDDNDGSAVALLTNNQQDESHTWSQEFTLTSDTDGPLTWVVGLNYYEDVVSGRSQLPVLGGAFGTLVFNFDQTTEAWAIFGQATYEINERLRATAGLRYSDEDKDISQTLIQAGFGEDCTDLPTNEDYQVVTPKFAVDYDLTEDVLLYASATRGYKAGGLSNSACGDTYDEEVLWLYEAGFKGQFFDDRLRLNLLAFYTDYEDYQASILINGSGEVLNVPEAEVIGVEGELTYLFTDSFKVDAGFSYLDTEQGNFAPPDGDPNLLIPANLDGNELPRAPETSFFINTTYDFSIGDVADATFLYEYSWSDSYFFDIFNSEFNEQDSFDVSNIRLIVRPLEVEGLSVQAYVTNLDDEDYFNNSIAALLPGTQLLNFADPRTFGLEVHYNF